MGRQKKQRTHPAPENIGDHMKENLETIRKLRLCDDDFFEKVMEDKDACQELLRVLMSDPKLLVVEAGVQKNVKNLQGRSVRLDMLCRRGDGVMVNVEVQRASNDDHFRRVRYNGFCLTANITDPGTKFQEVPDVCVIYISEFDIFKGGKTVYHVDKVVRETGKVIKDGLDEMYVNTVIDDGTEIAALMGCFHQEMVTDPRFPEIGKRVHYLKEDKKGVGIMCQALEKIRNDGRAEGRKEGRKEGQLDLLLSLVKEGVLSVVDAAARAGISSEEFSKKLQKN